MKAIEEFVDIIDTRKGFFIGVAKSIDDFSKELKEADFAWHFEKKMLQQNLTRHSDNLPMTQITFVQQLVSALALPMENEARNKEMPYYENYRSVGAIQQDALMVHIEAL